MRVMTAHVIACTRVCVRVRVFQCMNECLIAFLCTCSDRCGCVCVGVYVWLCMCRCVCVYTYFSKCVRINMYVFIFLLYSWRIVIYNFLPYFLSNPTTLFSRIFTIDP